MLQGARYEHLGGALAARELGEDVEQIEEKAIARGKQTVLVTMKSDPHSRSGGATKRIKKSEYDPKLLSDNEFKKIFLPKARKKNGKRKNRGKKGGKKKAEQTEQADEQPDETQSQAR